MQNKRHQGREEYERTRPSCWRRLWPCPTWTKKASQFFSRRTRKKNNSLDHGTFNLVLIDSTSSHRARGWRRRAKSKSHVLVRIEEAWKVLRSKCRRIWFVFTSFQGFLPRKQTLQSGRSCDFLPSSKRKLHHHYPKIPFGPPKKIKIKRISWLSDFHKIQKERRLATLGHLLCKLVRISSLGSSYRWSWSKANR